MGTSEISGQLRFLYICIENAWYILESLHNCYRLRKYDFEPGMLITFAGARLLWRTIRVVIILKNFTPVKWFVFPPGSCSTAPFLLVFHRKVHMGYLRLQTCLKLFQIYCSHNSNLAENKSREGPGSTISLHLYSEVLRSTSLFWKETFMIRSIWWCQDSYSSTIYAWKIITMCFSSLFI